MAAICTTSKFLVVSTSEEGYVVAKVNGVFYCSCYAPPRWSTERFTLMVDLLSIELTGLTPLVMAGETLGLLSVLAKLNIDLANVGNKSTFSRNGAESIIDVTFSSPGLIKNWRVDDGYTNSDHQAVAGGRHRNLMPRYSKRQ